VCRHRPKAGCAARYAYRSNEKLKRTKLKQQHMCLVF